MTFGSQTVGFVTIVGTSVYDDLGLEITTESEVAVAGCQHQPLSASETPAWLTNLATQIWQTIAPPEAAAVAAKSTGKLTVNGVTYEIIGGALPLEDFSDPFVVTILSKVDNP